MRVSRLYILLGLLLSSGAGELYAQNKPLQFEPLWFERLSVEDGLASNFITSVVQDKDGFVWIGTYFGLHKYDGYRFTVYEHSADDPNSLSHSRIEVLHIDSGGTLWVGTLGGGLNRFEPETESFTRFMHDEDEPSSLEKNAVFSILEDQDGMLWLGLMERVERVDPETGSVTHFRHDPNDATSISDFKGCQVGALYEDSQDMLWIGCYGGANQGGLNRFDPESGTFTRFHHDRNDALSLSQNSVSSIHEDQAGTLWVGTYGGGLNRFEPETETFTRYSHDPADRSSIGGDRVSFIQEDPITPGILWIGLLMKGLDRLEVETNTFTHYEPDAKNPHSLSSNLVWSAYVDRQDVIWVSTLNGLNRFDAAASRLPHYQHVTGNPKSLSSNLVTQFYEDRTGVIWIGTAGGGLNRFEPETNTFTHYLHDPENPANSSNGDSVTGIYKDNEGILWIAHSERGLVRFDRSADTIEHFRNPYGNDGNYIELIYEDLQGMLWLDTLDGLFSFDRASERFTRYPLDSDEQIGAATLRVTALLEDRNGTLWVGTGNGIQRYERPANNFVHMLHPPASTGGYNSNEVLSLYEDRKGVLWIGTRGEGLYSWDHSTEAFTQYVAGPEDPNSISSSEVRSIHESRDGMLWISTWGGGLNRLDPERQIVTRYPGQGPPRILHIMEDGNGNIWMSTPNEGLFRFDTSTEVFTQYGESRGAQSKSFSAAFGMGYLKSKSGALYFGGLNGFNVFYGEHIKDNPHPPQMVITDFKLFGESVRPGADNSLQKPVSIADEIRLSHNENDITFDFAALHFSNPANNQYEYMMEPYDGDWREGGTQPSATYTNIDPGNYVFRVKGASGDGVWSEEEASLAITVLPPWWRTKWAYLVYGLMFVTGIVTVDRVRHRRLIARERLRAEREKARAIESTNNELQRVLKHLTEAQDQLIHIEKMASLGQLTAGIAHEIKNPLNFVNNFAKISSDITEDILSILEKEKENLSSGSAHELKAFLDDLKFNSQKINEHGQRADGIIRSMLEHSRTGRGEKRAVDLNKLVDEYLSLAYHGVRAREDGFAAELDQNYDDAVGEVEIYPQEIGRVLINLFDNAFYAVNEKRLLLNGPYEPRVSVCTKKLRDHVEVRIVDNGIGISKDVQEKIFDPFFTTKPTGSGTGLGLSLSHEIVVQGHRGEIKVQTEKGVGAEFIIRLPA